MIRRVRLIFGPPRRSRLTICGVIRRVRLMPETTLSRVSDPRGGGCAATLAPRMIESVRPQEAQSTGVGTHRYIAVYRSVLLLADRSAYGRCFFTYERSTLVRVRVLTLTEGKDLSFMKVGI